MFIDASTIKLVPKENIKKNNSSNTYKASSCQEQNIPLTEEGDCKNNFQGPELPKCRNKGSDADLVSKEQINPADRCAPANFLVAFE